MRGATWFAFNATSTDNLFSFNMLGYPFSTVNSVTGFNIA